jgi:hypothetical protein
MTDTITNQMESVKLRCILDLLLLSPTLLTFEVTMPHQKTGRLDSSFLQKTIGNRQR